MKIEPIGDFERPRSNPRRKVLFGGLLGVCLLLFIAGFLWYRESTKPPKEAPEAEVVLDAQVDLPFQVLVPAYLPRSFNREKTQVSISNDGPQGQPMIELIYQTRRGDTLTIYEWLPGEQETVTRKAAYCKCICTSPEECTSVEMGMLIDNLRVLSSVSSPTMITVEEAQTILDTLGPATNRQVYSSLKEVPLTYSVPPPVEIPINESGIQEVILVVTPNGYNPEHFSVKKGVPVILTFRQLGQVGCGNELIFQWGDGKNTLIYLASPNDSQVFEFTPGETGEFRFNCPHLIYRGVMTVID